MSDIRSLEHPTLKVPYEMLNKRFRTVQKQLEKDVAQMNQCIKELNAAGLAEATSSLPPSPMDGASAAAAPSEPHPQQLLATLEERLLQFQARSKEAVQGELDAARNCLQRLKHLRQGCPEAEADVTTTTTTPSGQSPSLQRWRRQRVDRMLVEHFLRNGLYESALALTRHADYDLAELTNLDLFLVARDVETALLARDTAKCLGWCHDNKSKLRKMRSTLEFNLRLNEFVEMVRDGRRLEAVKHARKFLSSSEPEHQPIVQRAMALLIFPAEQMHPAYADLVCEERWQKLIEQFRQENYRLFQLSSQSVFSVALQAGLSVLKTHQCYNNTGDGDEDPTSPEEPPAAKRPHRPNNPDCPVCQEPLNELASQLPFAHCSHSRLICFITGETMNEHNHPMMLPNGYVYGEKALDAMARNNHGQVVCPRSKEIYKKEEALKVFVM